MNNKHYKIAIVDDENEILNMLQKFLTKSGKFTISIYSNPVTAVSSIDSGYDLILLDIMMLQMNGLDALDEIMKKNPEQKVIMMTAFSTLDRVLESHKIGAEGYIMKPFESLKILEDKMAEVLGL